MKEVNKTDRRNFLRGFGTVLATGSVVAVSGSLLKKSIDKNSSIDKNAEMSRVDVEKLATPYKMVAGFAVEESVKCIDYYDNHIYAACNGKVLVYNGVVADKNSGADVAKLFGSLVSSINTGVEARDIVIDGGEIYILHATGVEVYSDKGGKLRAWQACSDNSDFCSMTLSANHVFVADAANKHIHKYGKNGDFVRFINSPNRFIIPSYTFGVEVIDETLYCSNSGRHKVEKYTLDGEYIGSFGKAGAGKGMFAGCCNPVHLAKTAGGDILTSEKGEPRISCYAGDGAFRSILLDSRLMGGGTRAYDVKAVNNNLIVAGETRISIFQFDRNAVAATACANCAVNCGFF
ncbi:MAG: hypothetical protein LBD59_09550 [Prevotellaceae bacterium]|jgi:hypothetical protein|nr:hypothetical protein [Prevotellaceae bacterium]